MALLGAGPAALAVAPRDGSPVAVLAPPWAAEHGGVAAALSVPGDLVWASLDGRAAVIVPDGPTPIFKLIQAGAVLVVRADASALCAGSGAPSPRPGLSNIPSGAEA